MQTIWRPLLAILLCSDIHLLPQASGDRRHLQGSAVRPARFTRHSTNTIGKAGMHGAIAELVDFFGFELKPASGSSDRTDLISTAEQAPNGTTGTTPEPMQHHRPAHDHQHPQNISDNQHQESHSSRRRRWVQSAPHPPSKELKDTLYNAAFHDGAHGLHASTGMALVTTGNRFAFARVLQKFLHGLKSSLDGDLSNHAVVVGMTKGAKSICDGLRARYSHHCVLSASWSGHETEEEGGSAWHAAAELHKLELILNVLTLGYSVLYMEPDATVFRNPMLHLLSLQADIALPDSLCAVTIDNKTLSADSPMNQDTNLIFARATPPAVRFANEWISIHRHDIQRLENVTRHDQAVFNAVLGPRILRDFSEDAPSARLHGLSQDRFPSWCAGPCGCIGKTQVGPLSWRHTDDPETGVAEGTLECPDEVMDQWMVYRFGCTKSTAEKEAVMDICLAMLEDAAPIDTSITAGI